MSVSRVDSIDDPRLAGYARVGDEAWLAGRGWFIAEGRIVVERLIIARRQRVLSLLLNDAALAALAPLLAGVDAPIYVCAPRFFERLTGHHFHRGCLALAERPTADRAALDASSLLVLDRVADVDNVGSVFRSALAFGVGGVWLGPGCADPFARKAIRTSMAATLRVPFVRLHRRDAEPSSQPNPEREARVAVDRADPCDAAWREPSWPACVDALREGGFTTIALSPGAASDLSTYMPSASARFALLIGNEGTGLSSELESAATQRLRIAMQPDVDSLNLGVATGIALHWLMRGRVASG